jgi:dihydropyrimidinase
MYTRVIKNATIITSQAIFDGDIGITDGRIAAITDNLAGQEVIDASGKYVLPGGVDPHVHLDMQSGIMTTSDDWHTGTRAAAYGGTTTVIDFVEPLFSGQKLMEAFEARMNKIRSKAVVDYALHMTICNSEDNTLKQMQKTVECGMPSFKTYTTYQGFRLDDRDLRKVLSSARDAHAIVMVHAESDDLIQEAINQILEKDPSRVDSFPESRPTIAEVEAVRKVIAIAADVGCPVYFVHISTQKAAEMIQAARQGGQAVWAETCPQYLILDDSYIRTEDFSGAKYICNPPLRSPADSQALWGMLHDGSIQTIGTDHCAFNFSGQKDLGKQNIFNIPAGLPGIELRMVLVHTFGVLKGYISLPQWVDSCCTNPARLFGIYPQKGEIAIGSDADLVIFDPEPEWVVHHAALHENVDYTPYEGLKLKGVVESTFLRGEPLLLEGQWLDRPASGKFIEGKEFILSSELTER